MRLQISSTLAVSTALMVLATTPSHLLADAGDSADSAVTWRATFAMPGAETADRATVRFAFEATPVVTKCAPQTAPLGAKAFGTEAASAAAGPWCDQQCRRCYFSLIVGFPDPIACYNCLHLCRIYSPVAPDKPVVVLNKEEDD